MIDPLRMILKLISVITEERSKRKPSSLHSGHMQRFFSAMHLDLAVGGPEAGDCSSHPWYDSDKLHCIQTHLNERIWLQMEFERNSHT